jgi:hypothetical protein
MSAGVAGEGKRIAAGFAGKPPTRPLVGRRNLATVKPLKAGELIAWPKTGADKEKIGLPQKTWMIHLQHRWCPSIFWPRKRNLAHCFYRADPGAVISAAERGSFFKNFHAGDTANPVMKLFFHEGRS